MPRLSGYDDHHHAGADDYSHRIGAPYPRSPAARCQISGLEPGDAARRSNSAVAKK
jgi:hypothetical protein